MTAMSSGAPRHRTHYLQRQVEDAIIEGWAIERELPDRVILVKRSYGSLGAHVIIAILTVWWTFGIANAVYAAYKYFGDPQRMVLREDEMGEDVDRWAGRGGGGGDYYDRGDRRYRDDYRGRDDFQDRRPRDDRDDRGARRERYDDDPSDDWRDDRAPETRGREGDR